MGLTTAEFPKVIEFPKIITIDSSQGQESFMTIIDGSIKYRHRFGKAGYNFTILPC